MAKEFGWAFIGTGTLAKTVIRDISYTGRHKVITAYSRNREKLEAFCAPYGTKPCGSVEECINAPGIEAVYIVITNESHYAIAKKCLENGKHVLLEKPFTINVQETEALIALAKEKKLYLAEAMWTWFNDSSYKIRDLVQSGVLGDIKKVKMSFAENSIGYAPRVSDPLLGGGAVLDIGIYTMTYAYRLFGQPEAMKFEGILQNGIDIKENITYSYKDFDVEMFVSIVDSQGAYVFIEGTKGSVMLPRFYACCDSMYRIGDEIGYVPAGKGYVEEFDKVAEEIRSGLTESAYVPFAATIDNMKALDEARRQMGLVYPFEK